MADQARTRIDPETGISLVRGVRPMTLTFRSETIVFDMPGWYSEDDPTGKNGLHDAKDMQVSDRMLNRLKARATGLLAPEEIRKIRKRLKLTQRDAGKLIGGGPNAFQKYESADVVISKAADTALRLLARDPARLAELREGESA